MSHTFFISHFNADKAIAELFSNALRRITLEQISPWYSSDTSQGNGLKPGNIWFQEILSKITQSKAVVPLLTPNSINRPWIYFESGIGQSLTDCEIIPVCIGIQKDNVLPPLGLYQCYQLNDHRSVIEFFSKLLTLFGIKFDEEMSSVVIERFVAEISKISFSKYPPKNDNTSSVEKLIENFKNHIDKRFLEILEKPNYFTSTLKKDTGSKKEKRNTSAELDSSFSVSFEVDFPNFKNENLFVDVRTSDTFQSLTNTLFFMLRDYVGAFKYLEEWVIVNPLTGRHIIIREVAECIPATSIFSPDSKWKIIKLEEPYKATDSSKRVKEPINRLI